ncbi:MAG: hypothetical protein AMXMBFR33_01970 [Candidatus Xenobia bacterium]
MAKANNRDRGLIQYPDGTWGVLCVLGGSRHKRKVGTKDQARAYYTWCQQQNRERARGDWVEPEPELELPTVEAAVEEFLEIRRARGSESSLAGYRGNGRLFNELYGGLRLDQLTPRLVEAFVRGRLEAGVSPATVNRQLAFLKGVYREAARNLPADWQNPMARVKMLREDTHRESFLTPEQQERLRDHLPRWCWLLVVVAVLTGVRQGNLLRLRRGDVDRERKMARLPRTKDGKHFWVHLSDQALAALLEQMGEREDEESCRDELVWATSAGTPINPANLHNRVWKPALKAAGIEGFRWHDLRHTTAQRLIELAGYDLYTVQKLLGHKHPKTTQRYAQLSEAHLRKAAEALSTVGPALVQVPPVGLPRNDHPADRTFSDN